MQTTNRLNQLLNEARNYHPHYGDRLATHLPMVLIALSKLGANNEKLSSYFEQSVIGLEKISGQAKALSIDENIQFLGDCSKYENYLAYFQAEIASFGFERVLRKSLPILLPGISASAFHALIRLAYAIEAKNNNEIAVSLAYWSAEFQQFRVSEKLIDTPLSSTLATLASIGSNHSFSPGIIVDRMNEIGILLTNTKSVFQPIKITLSELRELSLKALYMHDDFTLLHTVTGCHAFSIVLPYIEDTDAAIREMWKAILIAYLSTGLEFKDCEINTPSQACDFEPIIKRALESNDSHLIKLVYTCYSEYIKHQNELYFVIAKRSATK